MVGYLISLATFGAVYSLLALVLNLMWGLTGMANLAVLAYFAVGAYASALLTVDLHAPIWLGLVVATCLGGLVGAASSIGIVRLSGDYLAIVTLGLSEVLRLVAENEGWLTGGTNGMSQIPQPFREAIPANYDGFYLMICLVFVLIALFVLERVRTAPFGRVLRAIRDDKQVTATAGKNVFFFQMQSLAVGGAVMGLAGSLYAHYLTFISPDMFDPNLMMYIFFGLIVGGKGNNIGAVVGSFAVVFLLESTRFLSNTVGLTGVQTAALRGGLIGMGLLVMLIYRPAGLIPEPRRRFRKPLFDASSKP